MISFPHSAQLPGSSRWPCMYPQLSPFYCQVVFHGTATSNCLTLHPHLLIQKEGSSAPSLSVKNRTYFSKLILYAHPIKFIAQQKCTEWKVGLTSIPHPSPQPHPVSVCFLWLPQVTWRLSGRALDCPLRALATPLTQALFSKGTGLRPELALTTQWHLEEVSERDRKCPTPTSDSPGRQEVKTQEGGSLIEAAAGHESREPTSTFP